MIKITAAQAKVLENLRNAGGTHMETAGQTGFGRNTLAALEAKGLVAAIIGRQFGVDGRVIGWKIV